MKTYINKLIIEELYISITPDIYKPINYRKKIYKQIDCHKKKTTMKMPDKGNQNEFLIHKMQSTVEHTKGSRNKLASKRF